MTSLPRPPMSRPSRKKRIRFGRSMGKSLCRYSWRRATRTNPADASRDLSPDQRLATAQLSRMPCTDVQRSLRDVGSPAHRPGTFPARLQREETSSRERTQSLPQIPRTMAPDPSFGKRRPLQMGSMSAMSEAPSSRRDTARYPTILCRGQSSSEEPRGTAEDT